MTDRSSPTVSWESYSSIDKMCIKIKFCKTPNATIKPTNCMVEKVNPMAADTKHWLVESVG